MDPVELRERCAALTTAHIADACLRTGIPVRCGPAELRPIAPGVRVAGRVCPARHAGSIDVFLEALERAAPGNVLVVDNGGRLDESCVGDLLAQEAGAARLGGVVIWGLHRETAEIRAIGLPLFSLGSTPTGPLRLDARPRDALEVAVVGRWTVGRDDLVAGDDDGVLFLPAARVGALLAVAETIRDTERRQAERTRGGVSLREQLSFRAYLTRRRENPSLTLRDHLRDVGGTNEV